jgi:hypothetical protein
MFKMFIFVLFSSISFVAIFFFILLRDLENLGGYFIFFILANFFLKNKLPEGKRTCGSQQMREIKSFKGTVSRNGDRDEPMDQVV